MKIFKRVLCSLILFVICVAILLAVIGALYYKGVIFTQDIDLTNKNTYATIVLTKKSDESKNNEQLYGRGFFIAPTKVACLTSHCLDGYDISIQDFDKNEYKLIDKQIYDEITILTTEESNKSSTLYLYGVINKGDSVYANISQDRVINNLTECKVLDDYHMHNGIHNIICEGQIEGKSSAPIIDKYGRIVGITWGNSTDGKSFSAYAMYEIIKNDPKLFWGIVD